MNTSEQLVPPKHQADLNLVDEALKGEERAVSRIMEILENGKIRAALVKRGASPSEADELLGDLSGDCFGGKKAKGGLHRVLAKFNGACPLEGYLQRIAVNRLISLKRKQKPVVELDAGHSDDAQGSIDLPDSHDPVDSEDSIVELIRDAVFETFASIDPERLVVFRLVHSYRVPQKRVGELWGWHESKVSRALKSLQDDLRSGIMKRVQERDPWLEIEWNDFLGLCSESIDLFGSGKASQD